MANINDFPAYEDTQAVPSDMPSYEDTKPASLDMPPPYETTTPVENKPEISAPESMAWGAASYGTADWADEILGFVAAAGKSFSADQNKAFSELYRENQKLFDERISAAQEQHPILFHGTGIAALLALPTGQAFGTVKGATALGAAAGLGRSKADLLSGKAEDYRQAIGDTITFAGLGAATGIAGKALGSLTRKEATREIAALEKPIGLNLLAKTEELINRNKASVDNYADLMSDRRLLENTIRKGIPGNASDRMSTKINNFAVIMNEKDPTAIQQLLKEMVTAPNFNKTAKAATPIADKLGVSVNSYLLYQRFNHEINNFASAIRGRTPKQMSTGQILKSLLKPKEVSEDVVNLIRQGKFNKENYIAFKGRQLLLEDAASKLEMETFKSFGKKDPMHGIIKRNVMDLRTILDEADTVSGYNTGVLADNLYAGSQLAVSWTSNKAKLGDEVLNQINKLGINNEKLGYILSGRSKEALTKEQSEAVNSFRTIWEKIRQEANTPDIDGTGGAFIPKQEDYFSQSAKPLVEYATELKKWAKEDTIQDLLSREAKPNMSIDSLRRVIKNDIMHPQVGENIERVSGRLVPVKRYAPGTSLDKGLVSKAEAVDKEIAQFVDGLERLNNKEIKSIDELRYAIDNIDLAAKEKSAMGYELGSAFAKKSELADRLRDWDAGRVYLKYINNMGKSIHLDKPINALNAIIPVYRQAGLNDTADYINTYLMDISGVDRGVTGFLNQFKHSYDMSIESLSDSIFKDIAREGPDAIRRINQSIYPNVIGSSPKGNLRNYAQLFMTTAPDVGAGVSSFQGYKYAFRAMKDIIKDYSNIAKEAIDMGLMSERFIGEGIRGADRKSKLAVIRFLSKTLDLEERVVMSVFSNSDKLNRMASMKMGQYLTKDLLSGYAAKRAGLALTKPQQVALSYVKRMESGYTAELQKLLKSGANVKKIEKLMATYITNKTQLVYGKFGASQLSRTLGPVLSMFTKWPVSITSEIWSNIISGKTRGALGTRIMAEKYMAPLLGLIAVDAVTKLGKTPRQKEIFSKEGLTYQSPLYSVKDAMRGDLFTPPPLKSAYAVIDPIIELSRDTTKTKQFQRNMKKALNRAVSTHMPFMSGINAYKHLKTIVTNKEEK